MNTLKSAFATLKLERKPLRKNETLRAWDAADELLLDHLAQSQTVPLQATSQLAQQPPPAGNSGINGQRCLIVNDAFGALACSLANLNPISWGDSYLAQLALRHNTELNGLTSLPAFYPSTNTLQEQFDCLIIKIPKTLALLEHQLIQCKPHLHEAGTVIAAGMVKHLNNSHIKLFEHYLGATTTSLAVKKARLIFSTLDTSTPSYKSPYPTEFFEQAVGFTLTNHANVFSREKLDIGSRFMMKQFNKLPALFCTETNTNTEAAYQIVDLGCGNGLLGIMARKHYQQVNSQLTCQLHFVDESYMAIESAKTNAERALGSSEQCKYWISDCLEQTTITNANLILCNPPFHQSHTIGTYIANRMFQQSKQALKRGGQLWVIANRHLNYKTTLKRLFGHCRTITEDGKFVVLSATLR